jgi:hypothetical protein
MVNPGFVGFWVSIFSLATGEPECQAMPSYIYI